MSYQALLFCPDEKTARTVTQVLSELDFTVAACTEPFAAVKNLMGDHFDAVVVDCDNEQNATLLFKSARSAPNNQSALAVAVVEGQAGVAKAFRIGANLVLTKPINVEQAKGTLRVARGLLRKNEGTKPANPGSTTAPKPAAPAPVAVAPVRSTSAPARPAPPAAIPPTRRQEPLMPAAAAARIPPARPSQAPGIVASKTIEITEDTLDVRDKSPVEPAASSAPAPRAIIAPVSTPVIAERTTSSGSAASAAAPARAPQPIAPINDKISSIISEPLTPAVKADTETSVAVASTAAPEFTFGGVAASDIKPSSGGSKIALLAIVAAVIVVAGGYVAWTQFGHSNQSASVPTHVPINTPAKPASTPAPAGQAPAPLPASIAQPSASETKTQTIASAAITPAHAGKNISSPDTTKPSASLLKTNKVAEETTSETPDAEPIVIKTEHAKPGAKSAAAVEAPAMSVTAMASADSAEALPNLMGPSSAPTPMLGKLVVSQGVSRGLLVKEVQPVYPQGALRMRMEGSVQMMATLSKDGNISEVKILSGDRELAHAAVDAVKKWKYKPYLLNGEPVGIQTQITVNFKLPR